jgi:hypothetical protein
MVMIKKRTKVYFFPNGNTAVTVNNTQSPKHQRSWFLKYVEFLEANRIDVLKAEYYMPDGKPASLIKTDNGYNWAVGVREVKN